MIKVVDAAVAKAYGGKRKIHWMEVYAGEKVHQGLRPGRLAARGNAGGLRKEYVVSIKGPLTTPVGGGIRSLNVALRQELDLYVCLRPVQYFKGVPSPGEGAGQDQHGHLPRELRGHLRRHRVREAESDKAKKLIKFLQEEMGVKKIRFPDTSGIGIKPVSAKAPSAWCARPSSTPSTTTSPVVTIVHKGNIMKFTEGRLPRLGLRAGAEGVRRQPDRRRPVVQVQEPEDRQGHRRQGRIADAFLQQILLRPAEYSVIATLNLNGDYISDALAAQVGGIGIAPGANLSDSVACSRPPTARRPSTPARTT
jgi:isocitrate dehydrogenase